MSSPVRGCLCLENRVGRHVTMLQQAVQAALDELICDGDEVGLQAAVIKDGALVADAQSGVADPASGEPVSAATLFFAGSTAKGILSSVVHALVAAGTL